MCTSMDPSKAPRAPFPGRQVDPRERAVDPPGRAAAPGGAGAHPPARDIHPPRLFCLPPAPRDDPLAKIAFRSRGIVAGSRGRAISGRGIALWQRGGGVSEPGDRPWEPGDRPSEPGGSSRRAGGGRLDGPLRPLPRTRWTSTSPFTMVCMNKPLTHTDPAILATRCRSGFQARQAPTLPEASAKARPRQGLGPRRPCCRTVARHAPDHGRARRPPYGNAVKWTPAHR